MNLSVNEFFTFPPDKDILYTTETFWPKIFELAIVQSHPNEPDQAKFLNWFSDIGNSSSASFACFFNSSSSFSNIELSNFPASTKSNFVTKSLTKLTSSTLFSLFSVATITDEVS